MAYNYVDNVLHVFKTMFTVWYCCIYLSPGGGNFLFKQFNCNCESAIFLNRVLIFNILFEANL